MSNGIVQSLTNGQPPVWLRLVKIRGIIYLLSKVAGRTLYSLSKHALLAGLNALLLHPLTLPEQLVLLLIFRQYTLNLNERLLTL